MMWHRKVVGFLVAIIGAISCVPIQAAIISQYTFTGGVLTPSTTAPNVTASSLGSVSTTNNAGSGFISDGAVTPSGNNQYSQTGFADGTSYFNFTVQAQPGFALDLSQFDFYQRLGSTGAGRTYSLQYVIDGVTTTFVSPTSSSTITYTQRIGALSIVNETRPIEFRIVGNIDNDATTFRIDDLTLTGTVSAIPEPSTWALGAGIFLLGFNWYRRKGAEPLITP